MLTNLSQTSQAQFLAMVNAHNTLPVPIDTTNVTIGNPVVSTVGGNTDVTLTAKANVPYVNSKVVNYDRLHLSSLIKSDDIPIPYTITTTVTEIITAFNAKHGTTLAPTTDIDLTASLPVIVRKGTYYRLTAAANSLAYRGTVDIPIKGTSPLGTALIGNVVQSITMSSIGWKSVGFVSGTTAYVIGGSTTLTGVATTSVRRHNISTASQLANGTVMPVAKKNAAGCFHNGLFHCVGGGTANDTESSNTHHAYDPVANTWATKTTTPLTRFKGGMVGVGNYLYHFGGLANGVANLSMFRYDITANTWGTMSSATYANPNFCALLHYNNKIYAVGDGYTAGVQVYDITTDTWSLLTLTNIPNVVWNSSSVGCSVNNFLYVMCGNNPIAIDVVAGTIESLIQDLIWPNSSCFPGVNSAQFVNGSSTAKLI